MASFLKQRLVGAIVLISLGIIFIPMLLTGRGNFTDEQPQSNVPPKPAYEIEAPVVLPMEDGNSGQQPVMQPIEDGEPLTQGGDAASAQSDIQQANAGATQDDSGKNNETGGPSSAAVIDPAAQKDAEQTTTPTQTATAKQATQPATQPETTAKQETPIQQASKPEPEEKPATNTPAKVAKAEDSSSETAQKPVVSGWIVQLGSFAVEKNALQLRDKLRKNGHASFVETYKHEGKTRYRVRVGPEQTRELADQLKTRLKQETQLTGLVMSFPE